MNIIIIRICFIVILFDWFKAYDSRSIPCRESCSNIIIKIWCSNPFWLLDWTHDQTVRLFLMQQWFFVDIAHIDARYCKSIVRYFILSIFHSCSTNIIAIWIRKAVQTFVANLHWLQSIINNLWMHFTKRD